MVLSFASPPNNHFKESATMKIISFIPNFKLSSNQLLLLTSAYIALVLNIPFFSKVLTAVTANQQFNLWFLLAIPIVLFCLTLIFHSFFAFRPLLKPFLIFSVTLSSLLFYATFHYGIIFDFGMVQNTIETDTAEALSYLNIYAFGFFIVLGLIPSVLIYRSHIISTSFIKELMSRLKLLTLTLIVLSVLVSIFYVNFASVGRNNRELTSYLTPFKLYEATFKYGKRMLNNSSREFHLLDVKPTLTTASQQPSVTVLVLGETARASNFALNGYEKATNQHTSLSGMISFANVSSCGTATAVSVPCMFSRMNQDDYDKHIADSQQNVVDLVHLAGADVLWVDNNNGGCKGVCKRVETVLIDVNSANPLCDGEYCYDEILLESLDTKLKQLTANNTLIVLHVMGSHGPTYFRRYPKQHRKFTPDCQRSDIQNCSQEELINTYDNTILYTDFVLSKIAAKLEKLAQTQQIDTSMLFISDHGESLGENGIYLHGLPYTFAPSEQTHIPMLFWQNSRLGKYDTNCIKDLSADEMSHDNFFDVLLGMMSIDSKVYNSAQDSLNPCRIATTQIAGNVNNGQ